MSWVFPQAFRDHEAATANPPTQYVPDEACAGGNHDLSDEGVVKIGRKLYCNSCAESVERCDQCGYYGCRCPDE